MSIFNIALLIACSLSTVAAAPQGALAMKVTEIGKSDLEPEFKKVTRDGGGGGFLNGHNVILFSDTLVNGMGPLTNTVVYSSPNDPNSLQDFGEGGLPRQAIPYTIDEEKYNTWGNTKTRIAIWPHAAFANMPNDTSRGVGIAPVSIQSAPDSGQPSKDLYNTMYTVQADDNGPSIDRVVPVLFSAGMIQYGTFGTFLNPRDGMLYFFANGGGDYKSGNPGVKVARADPKGDYANVATWTFWNGTAWAQEPSGEDATPNIVNGVFSTGDIFWSPLKQTFMFVYMLANTDNTFRYRYIEKEGSSRPAITGKWSAEYVLYDTSHLRNGGSDAYNYAGHAYPNDDPTGRTILLSCTLSDGGTPYFFRATLP